MGYDPNLFMSDVTPELICSICLQIMSDPMMLDKCEHFFCRDCILAKLDDSPMCPIDRGPFEQSEIRKPFPFIVNLLGNLQMKCRFHPECEDIIKQKEVIDHEFHCSFNPLNNLTCEKYCNIPLNLSTRETHDCISYFKNRITELEEKNDQLQQKIHQLEAKEAQNHALISPRSMNQSIALPVPKPTVIDSPVNSRKEFTREKTLERLKEYIATVQSFQMPVSCNYDVWKDTPYMKLLAAFVKDNLNVMDIIQKCNLSNFFFYERYSNGFELERFKKNSSLFLHVFLFELVEPYLNCNSIVLVLDYIDNGMSQWIAQKARWVTTAVNPTFLERLRKSTSKLRYNRKIGYIPYKLGLNKLGKEIKRYRYPYDFVISFSLQSDQSVEYIFRKFAASGKFLSFNRDTFTLKFYKWITDNNGNRQVYIEPLLNRRDVEFFLPLTND